MFFFCLMQHVCKKSQPWLGFTMALHVQGETVSNRWEGTLREKKIEFKIK